MLYQKNNRMIVLAALICTVACLGDIIITIFLGLRYPGYSQLRDTLSQMGSLISPVSLMMSIWWVVLGLLFVLFGVCLRSSPLGANKHIKIASWLIAIYGVGEGICSGLFPVSYDESAFNMISLLHVGLSGLGVLSILILPLVVQKIFSKGTSPRFYRYSYLVVILGLAFIGLFSIAKMIDDPVNFFTRYKGLWQRIFSLNFYGYLVSFSVMMLRYSLDKNK